MDKERKRQLDEIWLNTELGKWAIALSKDDKEKADSILEEIFNKTPTPYNYLMEEEKKLTKELKNSLRYKKEGKEYLMQLENDNSELLDIMIAHDFLMLDI